MKKKLTFLVFLLLPIAVFPQTNYDAGFKAGYKEGYCYNEFGCIPPIPPVTPIPYVGENKDNYQDGYNRGFKMGLEEKQKKSGNGKSENQSTNAVTFQSQYVPQTLPYNQIMNELQRRQAALDNNRAYLKYLQEKIAYYKSQTNEELFNKEMDKIDNYLISIKNSDLSLMGSELDQANAKIEEEVANYNKRLPNNLWKSGNDNFSRKLFKEAVADYTALINLTPTFSPVYFQRGLSFYYMGSYALAISDLDKYIELKSDDANAFSTRGWAKYYILDYTGALS
jgi:hypothetical protein